jgi:hypothetical protein
MKFHAKPIPVLLVCLVIVAASVGAQPSPSLKGEILEFGICRSVAAKTTTANPDTPNGERTVSKEVEFTEHTEKIPGTKGVMFGIRYKLSGIAGEDSVAVRKVVKHPPFKNKKGEMESEYSVAFTRKPKDGTVVSFEGYKLGTPGDLVPGTWIFEIRYGEQKLVSQSFTVVPPREAKQK